VVAAETDVEAARLFTSLQQAFVNLRTGRPGPLPPPVDPAELNADPMVQAMAQDVFNRAVVGAPDTVKAGIDAFARRTGANELMITAQVFDHAARLRSFEIAAAARDALDAEAASEASPAL
jgi:alkanesulfonate monooxygenase SsuD/methylene tetrahydromethanopterin reductase-like flavin-dependent oxidoreductase (luciferase family)